MSLIYVTDDGPPDRVIELQTTGSGSYERVRTQEFSTPTGYLSRYVWVDPSSDQIGTTFAGETVSAAPTIWTSEADIPPGGKFWWVQYGASGGSGSGAANRSGVGTFSVNGGGPSGGGYRHEWTCTRQDLIDALPISFQTPLGGAPGDAVSSNSISTVNGNPGVATLPNIISGTGLFHMAGSGGLGTGGQGNSTGTAGCGGGQMGDGTASIGGPPNDATSLFSPATTWNEHGGGLASTRTNNLSSGTAPHCVHSGAGGGSNTNASTTIPGGRSRWGGCGGGHGGRTPALTSIPIQASDGGNHNVQQYGVTGGGGLAGIANGEDGHDGADGSIFEGGQGGGGGMAGATGTPGGRGGRGGFPGGGSGGGGGNFAGGQGPANALSGAGRQGADGCTILTVMI